MVCPHMYIPVYFLSRPWTGDQILLLVSAEFGDFSGTFKEVLLLKEDPVLMRLYCKRSIKFSTPNP